VLFDLREEHRFLFVEFIGLEVLTGMAHHSVGRLYLIALWLPKPYKVIGYYLLKLSHFSFLISYDLSMIH